MGEEGQRDLLTGIVETDETYIGGKPRKGGPDDKNHPRGRGTNKIPVVGLVERGGKVPIRSCPKKCRYLKHHLNDRRISRIQWR